MIVSDLIDKLPNLYPNSPDKASNRVKIGYAQTSDK